MTAKIDPDHDFNQKPKTNLHLTSLLFNPGTKLNNITNIIIPLYKINETYKLHSHRLSDI